MTSSEPAHGGPRRVAVLTAARSDLAPLGPVIDALHAEPAVVLTVVVTGAHWVTSRGNAITELRVPADSIAEVAVELPDAAPASLATAAGVMIPGIAEVLRTRGIETLVLLGDRWELLPAATAAVLEGVAVVHLHGGELTLGAIDDRIRHAITKISDLHCCATDESARRIRQMGEPADRVVVTGAPGLDRHRDVRPLDDAALQALLGSTARPLGLVTYHPETVDQGAVAARARMVLRAAVDRLATTVITYPGVDTGADAVIEVIDELAAEPGVIVRPHLGADFPSLLASADVVVGNSSSGIWESATFGVPVVDIGQRQAGRQRAANVIHADHDADTIGAAIDRALSAEFRAGIHEVGNPYGDGHAAERIVACILALPDVRPLPKPFVELDVAGDPAAASQ